MSFLLCALSAIFINKAYSSSANKVDFTFWTSSNDYLGSQFKRNFSTIAAALDEQRNDFFFAPHLYILNGSHWNCDASSLPCKQQCSNNGRYCAVDPEYDVSIGLDGIDVVQEDLRSLCVWKYAMLYTPGYMTWWNYSVLWDENCGVGHNQLNHFNEICSLTQINKLDETGALQTFVTDCITNSGGYGYTDGVNTILSVETKLKYDTFITNMPMIKINDLEFDDTSIHCPLPITTETCHIFKAICDSFNSTMKPPICNPSISNCNVTEMDCTGTCHGFHDKNPCGYCLDSRRSDFTTYGMDCAGVCYGIFSINSCGKCIDFERSDFNDYGKDCSGTCTSTISVENIHYIDNCSKCLIQSDPKWNSSLSTTTPTPTTIGCDGIAGSVKKNNPCGNCIDLSRSDFETYGMDCDGACDGSKRMDECGQCLYASSIDWNACVGCDGVPFSNRAFNPCGYCVLKTDPNFDGYGKDCTDLCATDIATTYYTDDCGVCLLPSDTKWNNCLSNNFGSTECIGQIATGKSSDFTVNFGLNCSMKGIVFDIEFSAYKGNWFGIVLSDSMLGTALVYTTGKPTESTRSPGLYWYFLMNHTSSAIEYMNWDSWRSWSNLSWTEIFTREYDGSIRVKYLWQPAPPSSSSIFNDLVFSWAYGVNENDLSLTCHQLNRANTGATMEWKKIEESEATENQTASTEHPTNDPIMSPTTTRPSSPTHTMPSTTSPTTAPSVTQTLTQTDTGFLPCDDRISSVFYDKTGYFIEPFPYQFVSTEQCQNVLEKLQFYRYGDSCLATPSYQEVYRCAYDSLSSETTMNPTMSTGAFRTSVSGDGASNKLDITISRKTSGDEMKSVVSLVLVLFIVIGVLVLLLCLCGGYIFYTKYVKRSNTHMEYVRNMQMDFEDEGRRVGERDHYEKGEGVLVVDNSDQTTALAQNNRL